MSWRLCYTFLIYFLNGVACLFSLHCYKTRLDKPPSNLVLTSELTLLWAGGWTRDLLSSPPTWIFIWSYVILQLDNRNHLLEKQTRKSLQIFCCTASKNAVPYQKKAQKCFRISLLLPTCVASFCANIYYIPWLLGSLLAGTLPFGISRLSEAFGEWKGIGSYFCHSAIALVGRVSLGFQLSSNHILSLHSWEASPAWSAHLHWKEQPTITWFSCGIFEGHFCHPFL